MSYESVVLAEASLISAYLFTETSGTSTADAKGPNTGTFVNTPTLNQAGPAVSGTARAITVTRALSQCVTIPNSVSLAQGDGPLSWELCVARASTANADQALMFKGNGAPSIFIPFGVGVPYWYVPTIGNGAHSSLALNNTSWHHLVFTKALAGAWLIYVDGVNETTTDGTPTSIVTTAPLIIGGDGTYYFNGSIFLPAMYSDVLSPTQVAAHNTALTAATSSGGRTQVILI
jgi:hypothetical protein